MAETCSASCRSVIGGSLHASPADGCGGADKSDAGIRRVSLRRWGRDQLWPRPGSCCAATSLAIAGASIVVVGGLALGLHAFNALRVRARWTTDPGWHLLTTWSLVGGIGWFIVGSVVAAAMVIARGASPGGWQLAPLVGPMVIGWVAQVLVGAASHLMPAVGPGSPERHAVQRRILGWGAPVRLVALNLGAAALTLAPLVGDSRLFVVGVVTALGAAFVSIALLAIAASSGEAAAAAPKT